MPLAVPSLVVLFAAASAPVAIVSDFEKVGDLGVSDALDVSRVHVLLNGMIKMLPRDEVPKLFRGTPLENDLARALKDCATWGLRDNPVGFGTRCEGEAATALWQRFLDYHKPRLVIVLGTRSSGRGSWTATGKAYTPAGTKVRGFTSTAAKPKIAARAVVKALMAGKGRASGQRKIVRDLPAPLAADAELLLSTGTAAPKPIALPAPTRCSNDGPAPWRSIKVEPSAAPLAAALRSQYQHSIGDGRSSGEARCTLAMAKIRNRYGMQQLHTTLTCENFIGVGVRAQIGAKGTETVAKISRKMVTELLNLGCRGFLPPLVDKGEAPARIEVTGVNYRSFVAVKKAIAALGANAMTKSEFRQGTMTGFLDEAAFNRLSRPLKTKTGVLECASEGPRLLRCAVR